MGTYLLRAAVVIGLVMAILPIDTAAQPAATGAFERTWARTDQPVLTGRVDRTWMWGPQAYSEPFQEPYGDAPGGMRLVQYSEKSRMEDNSFRAAAPWDVTNGRLAYELVTGKLQQSDTTYEQRQPASVQVAGDNHPDSPTYASFNTVRAFDPIPTGWTITQTIDRKGHVGADAGLATLGVTAHYYVPETNHTVASVFWQFMNSSGEVYENGQYVTALLFENPFFATGFPITEAYWMYIPVGGIWQHVLAQCFERRCLTFTPGNPTGWKVEAGNIGQHYYLWRYGQQSSPPPPGMSEEEYAFAVIEILDLTIDTFEAFDLLMAYPTLTQEWYELFDLTMTFWFAFYLVLDDLQPPPAWSAFHSKLLDAYWVLALAAEDFIVGVYQWDQGRIAQGLARLDMFLVLLDESSLYIPESVELEDINQSSLGRTLEELRDAVDPDAEPGRNHHLTLER